MSRAQELFKSYSVGLRHSDVSGFELLDLLEARSVLASIEGELQEEECRQLEEADSLFIEQVEQLYRQISTVASLAETRRNAKIPPSHWWWYLDRLVEYRKEALP